MVILICLGKYVRAKVQNFVLLFGDLYHINRRGYWMTWDVYSNLCPLILRMYHFCFNNQGSALSLLFCYIHILSLGTCFTYMWRRWFLSGWIGTVSLCRGAQWSGMSLVSACVIKCSSTFRIVKWVVFASMYPVLRFLFVIGERGRFGSGFNRYFDWNIPLYMSLRYCCSFLTDAVGFSSYILLFVFHNSIKSSYRSGQKAFMIFNGIRKFH